MIDTDKLVTGQPCPEEGCGLEIEKFEPVESQDEHNPSGTPRMRSFIVYAAVPCGHMQRVEHPA